MKKILALVFIAALLTACGAATEEVPVVDSTVVVSYDTIVPVPADTIAPADTVGAVKK